MAKTNWGLNDVVQPSDLNGIGQEINQLREDVDNIEIPPASLTEAGIVQLSNATNSNAEDRAATPKAVKSAYDAAVAAQTTANAANLAAAAAQAKADAAETPSGAQAKVNAAVGNLSTLLTSAKSNTVAAINELFTSASNGKSQIAAAITGKGVPASGSDTFSQLATKIGQIQVGKKYYYQTLSGTQSNISIDFGFKWRVVYIQASYGLSSNTIIVRDPVTGGSFIRFGGGNYYASISENSPETGILIFNIYANGGTYHLMAYGQ